VPSFIKIAWKLLHLDTRPELTYWHPDILTSDQRKNFEISKSRRISLAQSIKIATRIRNWLPFNARPFINYLWHEYLSFQGVHKIDMDMDFQMHVHSPEHDYNPLKILVHFHEKNEHGENVHLFGYSITSEITDYDLFKFTAMAKDNNHWFRKFKINVNKLNITLKISSYFHMYTSSFKMGPVWVIECIQIPIR